MLIQMKNVSLWRGDDYLLRNVDWCVKKGEHWAILGLNGSGKTTLLNIVNGYLFPSSGEVSILGKTFGTSDLRVMRKSIGWVSSSLQERMYGMDSVLEIVISGKEALIGLMHSPVQEDAETAERILQNLGCLQLVHRPYKTLSQGEKQKVLIARALMAQPFLLVLDEPCTGLDIFAREHVLDMIENIGKQPGGPNLVYVTHRPEEVLPVFSHTLLLKNGRVYQQGRTGEIMTQQVLSSFYDTHVTIYEHNERLWMMTREREKDAVSAQTHIR